MEQSERMKYLNQLKRLYVLCESWDSKQLLKIERNVTNAKFSSKQLLYSIIYLQVISFDSNIISFLN